MSGLEGGRVPHVESFGVGWTCPWTIRFGTTAEFTVRCVKDAEPQHSEHVGRFPNPAAPDGVTIVTWIAGDRREYTGDWPGQCDRTPGCILPAGHVRRCAV